MQKIDYKKELKHLYGGKVGENITVDVPSMKYLMIDGSGNPNTSKEFTDAIETLYPVAYTLKFMCKLGIEKDYGVMPLEGQFWTKDMASFDANDKDNWLWTLMIMQPEMITTEMFEKAVDQVKAKKNPSALSKIRFQEFTEGRAAQVMYVGPYANEGPTIQKLHEFIASNSGKLDGAVKKHHEIYLSDMRRTAPDKLKTIIRQPY
jgi:hypothetical protein